MSNGSIEKTQHIPVKGDIGEGSRNDSPVQTERTRPQSQNLGQPLSQNESPQFGDYERDPV